MADINKISFYHLKDALSTATLESGAIYFSDADHTIGVYDGTSMQKYYGGNVKDAKYEGKKLTIKYYDGTADAVLDFNDVASASGVTSLLGDLRKDITALQGDSHTHDNKAVLDGISSGKVTSWDAVAGKKSDYDNHVDATDIHVTTADKTKWNDKQDALSADQLAAANSGITSAKVGGYDTHVDATDIHVTTADKTKWNDKQDALTETQLAAANSGITADKVSGYDNHLNNQDIHVTTTDKANWNAAEQNAKDYADGLAKNYDAKGAAAQALVDAKAYTDGEIGKLGTAAKKDVLTGAIADSTSDDLVTAAQVKAYASGVVGAMHFRGAVENTGAITDPASGDICLVGTKEYVYNGTDWVLFGDEGAYDTKGAASTAEQNAKTYADGLNTAMNARVDVLEAIDHDAYKAADNDVKTELIGSADTDDKDSATIVGAKKYADSLASNYAAASHTHEIADVNGLQDALDGKATSTHTHAIADVTGLQDALAGKADSGHNHDTVYSKLDHNHDDVYDTKGAADTVKSAVIGVNGDDKTKDTIYGAKAYADAAVAAATLVWKQF